MYLITGDIMTNQNFHISKKKKDDEYYTLYEDIDKELIHYENFLKDKTVFCNCDDERSAFYLYFKNNFERLKLRCVYFMHHKDHGKSYLIRLSQHGETKSMLTGDGSFDSVESVDILKKSDVVITNPPFSLFRSFVDLLVGTGVFFLIIGNKGAISYNSIFKYYLSGNLFLGYNTNNGTMYFKRPDGTTSSVPSYWYTNIPFEKDKKIIPTKSINDIEKSYYDHTHILNINKLSDIPYDYFDLMGVPVTYLDKHNPDLFDVIGNTRCPDGCKFVKSINYIDGKEIYLRVIIKRKKT